MRRKLMYGLFSLMIAAGSVIGVRADDQDFDDFMMSEFVDSMESDYLNMHYTVKDYGKYGIEKPELTMGTAKKEDYDEAAVTLQESLDTLHSFDFDALSKEQQIDYLVYENYLNNAIGLNDPLLDEYFNPNSGILDNIVTNMTEFVFREKEDFDDYLAVLDTIDEYMDEVLELTRWQATQGVFLNDRELDDAREWIADFVVKGEECPLIIIFDEKVDAFEGLTDEERTAYRNRNRDIVLNGVLPAYSRVSDELEKLRGSLQYEGGMVNYPGGDAYYRALTAYKTSSDMSVEEQVEFLAGVMDEATSYLYALAFASEDFFDRYETQAVDFDTAEEVLAYHQSHLDLFYPEGPEVVYVNSYLDPSVANDSVMAYYLNPPIDDIRDNVIRINGEKVGDINTMYETLAHEGFPGHLYQITWYLSQQPHPIRADISNMGYTEGWGMYTELSSWEYSGLDPDVAMMHEIETLMGYVFNAYCDLGVNGLGWTQAKLAQEMKRFGYGDFSQDMYEFVVDAPGQILPYGVGLAQFMVLQSRAVVSMGKNFNIVDFNKVLLTNGDRPFKLVEEDVDAYITGSGHTVSEDYAPLDCWFDRMMEMTDNAGKRGGASRTVFIAAGVCALIALIAAVFIIRNSKRKVFDGQ